MSRGGVTKLDVKTAKTALEARGVNPSVANVREELGGTGSPNTITRYLRELKAEENGYFGELGVVSQELASLVLQLHNTLHAGAKEVVTAAVAKAKTEFDEQVQALTGKMEALTTELAIERSAKEDLQSRLRTSESLASDLNTKFNNANAEIARLSEALNNALAGVKLRDESLLKAERSLHNEREGRAHYEAAVKQERERMLDSHSRETLAAQQSYREQENRITEMFEQSSDLTRKVAQLQADIGSRDRTIAELEANISKGIDKLEEQETKTDEMRIEVATHSALAKMLQEQNHEMTSRNESKSAELAVAASQIALLNDQLTQVKSELAALTAAPGAPDIQEQNEPDTGTEVKQK